LEAGERFGDFEVIEVAGEGGMGVVYRARQITLERIVALKVISPQVADTPDFTTRFRRESRLAASIDHPHVVAVHSAGELEGRPYIAMQWVDGVSLGDLLADGVPLEEARMRRIISQLAGALDAAHGRGLVHRDVKPPNVLVRSIAGSDHAYLTDFGIARNVKVGASRLTKTTQTVGTVGYMAPEQIKGEPTDGRADLYSLGVILYQCLSGRRPFEHDTEVALMFAHVNEERPRPSSVRPELAPFDDLVVRALALDPADRFQTGAELAEELARTGTQPAAVADETRTGVTQLLPEDAEPPPPPPPPPPPRRPAREPEPATPPPTPERPNTSRRILIALGIIALVAGIGVGAFAAAGGFSGTTTVVDGGGTDSSGDGSGGGNGGGGGGVADSTEAQDRSAISAALTDYETAYTDQSTSELGALFTSDVTRHGLAAGGCTETSGIDDVLATYQDQFDTGSGAYALTDVSDDVIDLSGDSASVSTGYTITPGGSGSVSFDFVRGGSGWLISRVNASC
jgi:serine/threonine protein kinase